MLGAFGAHPIVGDGFQSKIIFPQKSSLDNKALICNLLNQAMSAKQDGNHFGTWTHSENSFEYTQFSTTTEIRSYEDSPSFLGYSSEELWMLISTAVDALGVYFTSIPFDGANASTEDEVEYEADEIIASLYEDAKLVLTQGNSGQSGQVDHKFLWLRGIEEILTTVHFNPLGPTVSTYGLIEDSGDKNLYLVEISRHPMSPNYRIIDQTNLESGRAGLVKLCVNEALRNLPSAIDFLNTSDTVLEFIKPLILEKLSELEISGECDLRKSAHNIHKHKSDPWKVLEEESEPEAQETLLETSSQDSARVWLEAASDMSYLFANYSELPNAWDGSLNFQMAAGNSMGMFDSGPLLLIYDKKIGN